MTAPLHHCALALATAALLAGCSAGNPTTCTVTCGVEGSCPDGTSCGTDGYCYSPAEVPGSCSLVTNPDGGGGPDGPLGGEPDAATDGSIDEPDAAQPDADVIGPPDACSEETFAGVNNDGVFIPDNDLIGITTAIEADTTCVVVDTVQIRVDITHTFRGDIALGLTSPAGDTVLVLAPDSQDSADDIHLAFNVDIAAGQSASGQWLLTVVDNFEQDFGTLDRWSIGINRSAP